MAKVESKSLLERPKVNPKAERSGQTVDPVLTVTKTSQAWPAFRAFQTLKKRPIKKTRTFLCGLFVRWEFIIDRNSKSDIFLRGFAVFEFFEKFQFSK